MKRKLIGIVVLIPMLLVATAFAVKTGSSTSNENLEYRLIGHRGFAGEFPENTMESFAGAKEAQLDGIEIDIWESQDTGDLMIYHDAQMERLTGKDGFIWNVNEDNRNEYNIIAGNGYDSSHIYIIPTFEEVLEYASKNDLTVYLHIKTGADKGYELSREGEQKIIDLIKEYKMEDKVIVFSTKAKVVKPFCGKGLRVGRVSSLQDPDELYSIMDWLYEHDCDTFIITRLEYLMLDGLGQKAVDYCHERNIQIGTYWTPDVECAKTLMGLGCDFSFTDLGHFAQLKQETASSKPTIDNVANVDGGIRLQWSRIESATGYTIYRSKNDRKFKEFATIYGSSNTECIDNDVRSGDEYSYKVEGFIKDQKSLQSDAATTICED